MNFILITICTGGAKANSVNVRESVERQKIKILLLCNYCTYIGERVLIGKLF